MLYRIVAACLIVLVPHTSAFAAITYRLTDLGTLGGSESFGIAINDNGTAVGYSYVSPTEVHAFRWTLSGGIQDIGSNGTNSEALDVNNDENIVGTFGGAAYRWTSGDGLVLIDPGNAGSARDLNENSEAVGVRNLGGSDRTIRWSISNTPTVMFLANSTAGAALTDLNQFVGTNDFGASGYYSDGTTRTLINAFIPTDLNNSREIVGSVGGVAALLDFDTNTTTLLGKLSLTDTSSRAFGINEVGTIVGISEGTGAFLYDSSMGGLKNLSTMLEPEHAGWTILVAEDINNVGQIVGTGLFSGVQHAVILTPIPEPASMLIVVVALLTLAVGGRSRF